MLAMPSHELESFQHTQTWLALLLPQAWPWLWAGTVPSWRRNITGVCSTTSFAQEMLLEGTGEQAVLDLSLADHLLLGQGINNSIQLSGHLPLRTTAPPGAQCWAHLPLDSLWQERLKPLPFPCLTSKVPQQPTAHFTGVYF